MDDAELRQQFQSISQQFEGVNQQFEGVNQQFQSISQQFQVVAQQFQALTKLVVDVKESLEREIGTVRETVQRMDIRLAKIAAGAHYVTRLVEWSEKQDQFQIDILQRVQTLEARVEKLQNGDKR